MASMELTYQFGTGEEDIIGNEIVVGMDPISGTLGSVSSVTGTTFNANYCFGGTVGKSAIENSSVKCTISNITEDGMSLNWSGTDISKWGLTNDTLVVANLFIKSGGVWKGGKFEWTSVSRNKISFENIYERYNGWDLSAMPWPASIAFFVCESQGIARSAAAYGTWKWNKEKAGVGVGDAASFSDEEDVGLNQGKITSDLVDFPESISTTGMIGQTVTVTNKYPKFIFVNAKQVDIKYKVAGVQYYTMNSMGELVEDNGVYDPRKTYYIR